MKELREAIKKHPRLDDIKPSHSKDVTIFIRNLLNHINGCERGIEQISLLFDAFEKEIQDGGIFGDLLAELEDQKYKLTPNSELVVINYLDVLKAIGNFKDKLLGVEK